MQIMLVYFKHPQCDILSIALMVGSCLQIQTFLKYDKSSLFSSMRLIKTCIVFFTSGKVNFTLKYDGWKEL